MPWNGDILFATFLVWVIAVFETHAIDCPIPPVIQNFTRVKYIGTWYEIESSPHPLEIGGRCISFRLTEKHPLSMNIELNMESTRLGKTDQYVGLLTPQNNASTEGKYAIVYLTPDNTNKQLMYQENYWILDTDYDSYSIVWSCKEVQMSTVRIPKQRAWILGRKPQLDDNTYANVDAILKDYTDFFPRYLMKETIPCSKAVLVTVSYITLLMSFIIQRTFVST